MKPEDAKTFEDLKKVQIAHNKTDEDFQNEFRAFIKRCEPMLQVFEDNRIYKMKFKEETGTVVFYIKAFLTFAGAVALLWTIIKNFTR